MTQVWPNGSSTIDGNLLHAEIADQHHIFQSAASDKRVAIQSKGYIQQTSRHIFMFDRWKLVSSSVLVQELCKPATSKLEKCVDQLYFCLSVTEAKKWLRNEYAFPSLIPFVCSLRELKDLTLFIVWNCIYGTLVTFCSERRKHSEN